MGFVLSCLAVGLGDVKDVGSWVLGVIGCAFHIGSVGRGELKRSN